MSHLRISSTLSDCSDLTELSESSVSSDVEVYDNIANEIDSLPLSDNLLDATTKVHNIIDKLQEDDEFNIYAPAGTDVSQKLHDVCLGMLERARNGLAKQYVLKTILLCARIANSDGCSGEECRKHLLGLLRSVAITWLTQFLFIFKAGSRSHQSNIESASPIATPTLQSTTTVSHEATPIGPRALNRDIVVKRDNYSCLITGARGRDHPTNRGVVVLKVAHILKRAAADSSPNISQTATSASITFDILRNYIRLPEKHLDDLESCVDHPSNALTMVSIVQDFFDTYDICLKERDPTLPVRIFQFSQAFALTDRDAIKDVFDVEYFGNQDVVSMLGAMRGVSHLSVQPPFTISVSCHNGRPQVEKPDPDFIAIHANIAGVLHMSGAGKFFDELLSKYPPTGDSSPAVDWTNFERQIKLHQVQEQLSAVAISGVA